MQEKPSPSRRVPVRIAIARILIISGMSIATAAAIFLFLAGVWQVGLPALGLALVFLVLMFLVERSAE
jgi:predicted membrane metal-binding protein